MNLDTGETRTFEHGLVQLVRLGSITIGRARFEPGWRWSNDVKPIAGTASCMVHHTGYAISGRLHVVMDDGSEFEMGAGDAHDIPPGHDAWVLGDEPYVGLDFSEEIAGYAKPS
jgi:hypothetical protein